MAKRQSSVFLRALEVGFVEIRQIAVLEGVLDDPGHSVREYARNLKMSKPSITRACDVLIHRGLLKRKRSTEDTRLVVIEPTAKGQQIYDRVTT